MLVLPRLPPDASCTRLLQRHPSWEDRFRQRERVSQQKGEKEHGSGLQLWYP